MNVESRGKKQAARRSLTDWCKAGPFVVLDRNAAPPLRVGVSGEVAVSRREAGAQHGGSEVPSRIPLTTRDTIHTSFRGTDQCAYTLGVEAPCPAEWWPPHGSCVLQGATVGTPWWRILLGRVRRALIVLTAGFV